MSCEQIALCMDKIVSLCKRYQVHELALFGSSVTGGFGPDSDYDFLVEFNADAEIGFMALAAMQRELSEIVGRKVDLVPKGGLKRIIRDEVLASAEVLYAA